MGAAGGPCSSYLECPLPDRDFTITIPGLCVRGLEERARLPENRRALNMNPLRGGWLLVAWAVTMAAAQSTTRLLAAAPACAVSPNLDFHALSKIIQQKSVELTRLVAPMCLRKCPIRRLQHPRHEEAGDVRLPGH